MRMDKNMELIDTVEDMTSDHWQDRLRAEYYQTSVRLRRIREEVKLRKVNKEYAKSRQIPLHMLLAQLSTMEVLKQQLTEQLKSQGVPFFEQA